VKASLGNLHGLIIVFLRGFMDQSADGGAHSSSSLIVDVQFTIQMVRNLLVVFEATSDGNPLNVEIRDSGVWVLTPEGHPLFVGPMKHPNSFDA
jgi:hypothetical protein